MAGTTGLEPATSAVTGQRSNQLNYVPTRQINEMHNRQCLCGWLPVALGKTADRSGAHLQLTIILTASWRTRKGAGVGVAGQFQTDPLPTLAYTRAPLANAKSTGGHRATRGVELGQAFLDVRHLANPSDRFLGQRNWVVMQFEDLQPRRTRSHTKETHPNEVLGDPSCPFLVGGFLPQS